MPRIINILLLLVFSSLGHANCEGVLEKLNTTQPRVEKGIAKDPIFADCKVWPFDPSKTILALTHFQEGSSFTVPPDPRMGLYDLTVLVVKSDSGEILNRLFQKGAYSSDAISLEGIAIDLAPYKLARSLRAFGVRARFFNSSAAGSWEHEQISLYVPQDRNLKQVLSRLVLVKKLYEQVNDCNESSTDTNRTLAIATTSSHGYADLVLKEKTISRESKREKNECLGAEKTLSRNFLLRFNGVIYAVPTELQY